MKLSSTTPILRIFDEDRARAFYVDWLGFRVDWEHRFEDYLPLYMQLSRDGCVIHLSGHHGDGCPGAAVRIETDDVDALAGELADNPRNYAPPGVADKPWGTRDLSIMDPFGNRLTFTNAIAT